MPRTKARRRPRRGTVSSSNKSAVTTLQSASVARLTNYAPVGAAFSLADLPERIAPNVTVDDTSGCWVVGPGNGIRIDKDGYARLTGQGVHRVTYTTMVGEIPADRPVLDHVKSRGCIWRNCCRPDHLEPVTVRTNTMRGRSFAVTNSLKTHCGSCGAEYDLYNTYVYRNRRDCRRCIRRRSREYAQRKRQRAAVAALGAAELGRAA